MLFRPPLCEGLEPRVLLSGTDPITNDHPLWAIPRGTAVVDGVLDEDQWANAFQTTRSLAYNETIVATIFAMWDDDGIYLAAEVLDQHLWADGNGAGAGERWQIENDDSITFYFDIDKSRNQYFQATDFAFGYNIAGFDDPKNDAAGPVRRYKFVKGDGAGGAPDVGWFGDWDEIHANGLDPDDFYLPDGAAYATATDGTINDDSDTDTGWTTEFFMPWSGLGITTPAHADTIGMNFDLILDDTGSTRDFSSHRFSADRWTSATIPDDHLVGVHSSYNATTPGVEGPVSYAETMFVDAGAGGAPATISDLAVGDPTGYSARLVFTAPAASAAGAGHVSAYQVRSSAAPIVTTQDWLNATVFENRYTPRLAGKAESLRFIGLAPSTEYFVAIRPADAAGNLGEMSTISFTTQSATQDPSGGLRLVPSPLGRSLVTEAGDPFMVIGDHLGLSWAYTRQMFPGDVWDSANSIYQNYSQNIPREGVYTDYFDELQARGVNTMRVFIEQQTTNADGNPNLPGDPRGTYWLEHNVGQYNPDMRAFLETLITEADRRDMYLILSPFAAWYYRDAFGTEGPWATGFGGPLTTIDDFFQEPATLTIAKNRMAEVVTWVHESSHPERVVGYEIINEWNTTGWTENAEGDSTPDRAVEMARRAVWVGELARYTTALDPKRLVINPIIGEHLTGATARSMFYSRDFDVLMPHYYTLANEEGINNPSTDRAVRAAVEQARATAAWLNIVEDRRPILNGEWGPSREPWPTGATYYTDQTYDEGSYSDANGAYTLAEDEELFSAVLWAGLAAGQFGTAMRMPGGLMNYITGVNESNETLYQGYLLSDNMRATQQLIAAWRDASVIGFDFGAYSPDSLAGKLSASSASGFTLHAFGAADGGQGIVYVLQDRDAKAGAVGDATLAIAGLDTDSLYDIEIWQTDPGTTAAVRVIRDIFSTDGSLSISLPAFNQGLIVRFRAHRPAGQVEQIAALAAGTKTISFARGLDRQPIAVVFDSATDTTTTVDIAALTNFRGRAVDMTPYRTTDGVVHLALTDEQHHLWLFNGNLATGAWASRDLTAGIDAPGMSGDLTVYQPTWGAIHIGGLDARGHSVNYWWAPGQSEWQFADLTGILSGPEMAGGLASWVAPWGALNVAGLNDAGDIIVYWWVPGMARWATLNMTAFAGGPKLEGQLSAFVTPWGAMNIIGLDSAGHSVAYWWVPRGSGWVVSDLTAITGTASYAQGLTTSTSTDGGINIFGTDTADHLIMLRWTPASGRWNDTDITTAAGSNPVDFPVGAASAGRRMTVGARTQGAGAELLLHVLDLDDDTWTWQFGTDGGVV